LSVETANKLLFFFFSGLSIDLLKGYPPFSSDSKSFVFGNAIYLFDAEKGDYFRYSAELPE